MNQIEHIQKSNNRRIAKNTGMLYIRMIFLMAISLYTSRAILQILGVEDYGVYNVVGCFVALFSIITGSLTSSISRYITVGIGVGDKNNLENIFSTSLKVQLLMSLLILLLTEGVGIWFLTTKMQIPIGRESAALYVLQFTDSEKESLALQMIRGIIKTSKSIKQTAIEMMAKSITSSLGEEKKNALKTLLK